MRHTRFTSVNAGAAHMNPPLTTVVMHPQLQGDIASKMLLERIQYRDTTWKQHLTESRLVIRGSSEPLL